MNLVTALSQIKLSLRVEQLFVFLCVACEVSLLLGGDQDVSRAGSPVFGSDMTCRDGILQKLIIFSLNY